VEEGERPGGTVEMIDPFETGIYFSLALGGCVVSRPADID